MTLTTIRIWTADSVRPQATFGIPPAAANQIDHLRLRNLESRRFSRPLA